MLKLQVLRLKPGEVETLRAWMADATRRREEALETFRNEGMRAEQWHLVETSDGPLAIVAMESEDAEVASAAYARSQLPIDLEFGAMVEQVVDDLVETEVLLDLALPDAP